MIPLISKKIVEKIKFELKEKIKINDIKAQLDIVLIGNDDSSNSYVKSKIKVADELNIKVKLHKFANIKEKELFKLIEKLNENKECNGIIIQLPVPSNINVIKMQNLISPLKDVDCFNPINIFNIQNQFFLPPIVNAFIELTRYYKISLKNKKILLIGRGKTAGFPILQWLLTQPVSIINCDKNEKNINSYLKWSEIIISCTGRSNLIDPNKVVKGYIFDVGCNKTKNGKFVGDCKALTKKNNKLKGISPVPGGIGPLTVVMLFQNLLILYDRQKNIKNTSNIQSISK